MRSLAYGRPRRAASSEGVQAVVPLAEIQLGDSIVVLPGQRIPGRSCGCGGAHDGRRSMLTGEATPLEREPGGRVLAGSLNSTGL